MYSPTLKGLDAARLLGSSATHILLYGGSRSGKTFAALRAIAVRALKAPRSRHAVLRHRFSACKISVVHDTWPKMLELCYPDLTVTLNRTDWYAEFSNGSQVWFGGLDDKERTEKILGQEHATIFLNEISQIPYASRLIAVTRLAQKCESASSVGPRPLPLKMYYDCNPPNKSHWAHDLFIRHRDPESKQVLSHPADYVAMQLNPGDNLENLPAGYLDSLADMPARFRTRFLLGEFADTNANALWSMESIDKHRIEGEALPTFVRVVVAVDPSGAGDEDNAANDAIGIMVCALGVDGNAYVLEDITVKAGPAVWGKVAASAYERHKADCVVGEVNYGGAMVKFVLRTANPNIPFRAVTATRGKVVRAEPISALYELGKIRHVGRFNALEDELCGFTTTGYIGERSPNRADALIWALTELFPGIVALPRKPKKEIEARAVYASGGTWMG